MIGYLARRPTGAGKERDEADLRECRPASSCDVMCYSLASPEGLEGSKLLLDPYTNLMTEACQGDLRARGLGSVVTHWHVRQSIVMPGCCLSS